MTMHKPFHDVLHPPELQGRERRRYWIAVGGWFVFTMTCLVLSLALWIGILVLIEGESFFSDKTPAKPYGLWGVLACVVIGAFLGDYLWGKAFVKSGYLSPAAAIRIRTNRAPTARGERAHRKLSLSLAVLIPLGIAGLGVYARQYWLIPLMMIMGLWLFISLWAGWKQSDAMIEGQAPYPDDEVKRVLHDIDPQQRRDDATRAR